MIMKRRLKKIFKDPIFIINFKLFPEAFVEDTFERCFLMNIPELNVKRWFKVWQIVPMYIGCGCIFDIKGFYIYREELYRKGAL